MKNNFWEKLKKSGKPILALAPMAGFTDEPFRQICSAYGADVVYSEMASATALYFHRENDDNETLRLLKWNEAKESKYVVQLFGSNPDHFAVAARIITQKIKPHGIDINFGCPVGKVLKQGAGADLMRNLTRARSVIEATLANTNLPVSVKIRAKSGEVDAVTFLKNVSDLKVSALMIHGRTLSQGFVGDPDYAIVNSARPHFHGVILINGGLNDRETAKRALEVSEADGLGLGRGALARPWLFEEIKDNRDIAYGQSEIVSLLYRHAKLVSELKGEGALVEWRKQACWSVQGLPGASRLRSRLVQVSSMEDVINILNDYGLND
ncbi:hypothetical protein CVU83_03160 [Candidatus Falkowbacteria bacterium HGW-Falkowbacteria-2]|uniref:tRNA-dihydrouridine synthase n=1 Tax=Candidatus Falkowbacteria bacterium HGW-Falkowbacteria-2 TaxID=2013769 RepID=A0A2N2DXZ8_9BACT|nr:MAG: hypothetical protein CVU83_03160 [Candidatus Falkowbacteria bacterium HGW-Falkowbacteria-2]